MATLTITKNYADGTMLEESEIDPFINNTQTFINTTKLNNDNIQNAGITASTKLVDGSLSAAKLASNSVLEVTLAAANVTTVTINDLAVTEAKLPTAVVTTAKIADSTVAAGDFAAGSVTYAKTTLNYHVINPDQSVPSSYPDLNLPSNSGKTITWTGIPLHGRPVLVQIVVGRTLVGLASNIRIIAGFRDSLNNNLETFYLDFFDTSFLQPTILNFFWETTTTDTYEFNLVFNKTDTTSEFDGSDTNPTRPTVLIHEL